MAVKTPIRDNTMTEGRFTKPSKACPHPERWHSTDSDSTEIEVSELVGSFVRALQPDVVVETGTAYGQTAEQIGMALRANGQGRLYTFEPDPHRIRVATRRCDPYPVALLMEPSLPGIEKVPDGIGFAWLDSLLDLRVPELQAIRSKMLPGAIIGVHDCGAKYPGFSQKVWAAADGLGLSRIVLPTPRGVTFLQVP